MSPLQILFHLAVLTYAFGFGYFLRVYHEAGNEIESGDKNSRNTKTKTTESKSFFHDPGGIVPQADYASISYRKKRKTKSKLKTVPTTKRRS